jgi:RNA polymerase sigma-70 factor (ECF subfamily)
MPIRLAIDSAHEAFPMADPELTCAWVAAPPGKWRLRVVTSKPGPAASELPSLADLDDRALVELVLTGRAEAFDTLVARHQRAVYQVCYRFAGNHEDASDATQEVFVRAWRGLGRFKGQAALATWLYRIAVNACLNRFMRPDPVHEAVEPDRVIDRRQDDPRAVLLRRERALAVRRAIAGLPRKQRAALILRAYHDLSHQEIADIVGSSVGAVKANFFHALANLKRILGSEP